MANTPEAPDVAGVILAAGMGARMGCPKLLLPWGGRPLVRHLAEVALYSQLQQVLVVTGHEADQVHAALAELPIGTVYNPQYRSGQSSSLRAGIAALPASISAAVIILADQPLLTSELLDRLIATFHQSGAPVVAPVAGARRGNPVLFGRDLFPELLQIEGDQGARAVVERYRDQIASVEVDAHIFKDIDTPEAYAALQTHDDHQER